MRGGLYDLPDKLGFNRPFTIIIVRGGVKVGNKWKFTYKHACSCAFMFKIAQKHAGFYVFSPFSASFDL